MKLLTVPEMIAIEKAADAGGHSYARMMEHAGRGVAEIVHAEYGGTGQRRVVALVGRGNNGGDALVALDYLRRWGWEASFVLVRRRPDELISRAVEAGCDSIAWPEDGEKSLRDLLAGCDVLLDGLLGTGIHLPLRAPLDACLELVKAMLPPEARVVAVDVPSGVDCDTGEAAAQTLAADITVTMAAAKVGHYAFPAANLVGELRLAGIGLPPGLALWEEVKRRVVDRDQVAQLLPERPADAHKGTFGTVVVTAGSRNFVGAALLAGKAAFRSGAGMVMTACTRPVYRMLAGHFPESTWLPLPEEDGVLTQAAADILLGGLGRASALLIGPGFAQAELVRGFMERLLSVRLPLPPMVVDADGLKLLASLPEWPQRLPPGTVLTPHPGEMSVLSGMDTSSIQAARLQTAEYYARKWGHVVVLKGAHTILSAPDGRSSLVPISTPALARAGTGDVLAGIIAGLRAQGLDGYEAAVAGAWLHGRAGLRAEEQIGHPAAVLAGDVLDSLAAAMAELTGTKRDR